MSFQNILVVCVGNICRSPMAEALLKQAYPLKNIFSAGLDGLVGRSVDPLAIECMSEVGIDISAHIVQKLDAKMLIQADIILAMTTGQVREIEERWTFSKGKVFRLCHWSGENVSDPYRQEKAVFVSIRDLIIKGVGSWRPYLS
ncbi:MAG: low molecular weight phosphotyrosine protein phosphatase [Gammaproteobacteria bacterium]|nr:low molecular weight phosphotyrosine protein phosphatase [Gammaproteobacteria bacterium]